MSTLLVPELAASPSAAPWKFLPRYRALPAIFHIVLIQAERHRRRGAIPEETFTAQMSRLATEELAPRELELLVRRLPCGTTRFLVKAKATGRICDMIDCPAD